jgi:hypothetical protein
MAHKNERESTKYNAVMDLIRMLATRQNQEGKAAEAEVNVEQDAVKVLEEQLEAEKEKDKAVESQLQRLTAKYAAVKLLVGEEHAAELRNIEKMRHKKSERLGMELLEERADDITQGLAKISFAESAASPGKQEKQLQLSMWAKAGGSVRDMSQGTSQAVEDQMAEEDSAAFVADGVIDSGEKGKKKRARWPRALKRARAVEMAAANNH